MYWTYQYQSKLRAKEFKFEWEEKNANMKRERKRAMNEFEYKIEDSKISRYIGSCMEAHGYAYLYGTIPEDQLPQYKDKSCDDYMNKGEFPFVEECYWPRDDSWMWKLNK